MLAPSAAAVRSPARIGRRLSAIIGSLVAIVAVWQCTIWLLNVSPLVAPSPVDVFSSIYARRSDLAGAAVITLGTALVGLLLGGAGGFVLAVGTWWSRTLRGTLSPLLLISQSVPAVALAPILTQLLGYERRTVVAVVVIFTAFPTFVFSVAGLSSPTPANEHLFASLGATRWRRFRYLALPASLPDVATGVRISATSAMLAALVAEFLVGVDGLGVELAVSRASLQVADTWGAAAVAIVLSVAIFEAASGFERRVRARNMSQ